MYERRKILELFDEQQEAWEARAAEGIERYRKGNTRITVTDREGNPLPGARITVKQKSHEFRFGANIFMLDELETEEKNEAYKTHFAEVFNMATLPFYWDALEPERGKPRYDKNSEKVYRRPAPDLCIEFCEQHGIEPREHALAYDAFFPKWLYDAPVDEIKRELERRYKEISERYADKIPTIEVTNEMDWVKGKTAFYDEPDFIEWCFKLAEKYFPRNQLCINERTAHAWSDKCRYTDKYYAYTEAAMLKGARIDAIGMQYHLFHKLENEYKNTRATLNPLGLYKHMDLYSTFGKPLQITEVTIPAYSWNPEDEELQAETLEKLYTVWFSHPNVEQIVYWNVVDGYAHLWDPDPAKIRESQGNMTIGENYYHGGLLRFDLSPKPAYLTLRKLIHEKWHTEDTLITDENGVAEFRGFYGGYDVEICTDEAGVRTELSSSKQQTNAFTFTV